MCTVLLAIDVVAEAPLIVAANRDEFRARPTEPFQRLAPGIFGGKDSLAGGTWFAVRPDGAMALLTNVRPGAPREQAKKSRGEIVVDLLRSADAAAEMKRLDRAAYNPFNVLYGKAGAWWYTSSESNEVIVLSKGVHLLGNTFLDDPSDPKTAVARAASLDRVALIELLRRDFYVDMGPYGTRWSMLYMGPHGPIDAVEIAERSVHDEPFVRRALA